MWLDGVVAHVDPDLHTVLVNVADGTETLYLPHVHSSTLAMVWKGANVSFQPSHGQSGDTLFVLEPEHILDVTEISECITHSGILPTLAILRRFQPKVPSISALRGSLINAAFDFLVAQPQCTESEIRYELQKRFALTISAVGCPGILDDCLKYVPRLQAALQTWQDKQIKVEPHVVSATVGLQGRFDILLESVNGSEQLWELKTGAAPNSVRLNHVAQLAAYSMLFEQLYHRMPSMCGVWYVTDPVHPLRSVSHDQLKSLQRIVLDVRNTIVATEHQLNKRTFNVLRSFTGASLRNAGVVSSFESDFAAAYRNTDVLSRTAMQAWLTAIVGEQFQARIGIGQSRSAADLWRLSAQQKESSSTVLTALRVVCEESDMQVMHLVLKPADVRQLQITALRAGDMVLIHPEHHSESNRTFLLFKAVIRSITSTRVEVSLRNKQAQLSDLMELSLTMEQDVSDAGQRYLTSGLYRFLRASESRRLSILGAVPPRFAEPLSTFDHTLTVQQNHVVNTALAARDWYLIQGPPGTGKTSAVLRSIVERLVTGTANQGAPAHEHERVLVLAYTNRAVNEICDVLQRVLPPGSFIRHGTLSGMRTDHSSYNLPMVAQSMSAEQLSKHLQKVRCVISTIHSVHSQPEILSFGRFTTAVIDEASQVQDVHLAGILSEVQRHILIGDHKQLPPVVAISSNGARVSSDVLRGIGMYDLSESIFQRLVRCCEQNNWTLPLATLEYQGRMHSDVMRFPSAVFYQNRLHTLHDWQTSNQPLPWQSWIPERACFIHESTPDLEARRIAEIVIRLLRDAEAVSQEYSVGIISPFRIHNRRILHYIPIELQSCVTVDTVERFQGSERDVIIYSTAASNEQEFESIRSDVDGMDRKLNVAVTRARQQFIMVGNADLYSSSWSYQQALLYLHHLTLPALRIMDAA